MDILALARILLGNSLNLRAFANLSFIPNSRAVFLSTHRKPFITGARPWFWCGIPPRTQALAEGRNRGIMRLRAGLHSSPATLSISSIVVIPSKTLIKPSWRIKTIPFFIASSFISTIEGFLRMNLSISSSTKKVS